MRKRLRRIAKVCLDDEDDAQVLKRRFLQKNYTISRQWGHFSSEWCVDFRPDGRDMFGVSNCEFHTSLQGSLVNQESWGVR
jgi:hypothetical protein